MFKFITKHCGIVSCFLNGRLHPISTVGSKVWVKNMPRISWARCSLRIACTFVDDFSTLNYCYLGGITLGSFRLDYGYEIEYEYDFSILVFKLHIITTHTHFIP